MNKHLTAEQFHDTICDQYLEGHPHRIKWLDKALLYVIGTAEARRQGERSPPGTTVMSNDQAYSYMR
jgi:hypothetical protein